LIRVLVLVNEMVVIRLTRYRFKLKDKMNQSDLKPPAYYTLLWIACIEDTCNLYRALKDKHRKYPIRMY